ncbi:unnamed protein product, partial [Scytosiphon promiscuus]
MQRASWRRCWLGRCCGFHVTRVLRYLCCLRGRRGRAVAVVASVVVVAEVAAVSAMLIPVVAVPVSLVATTVMTSLLLATTEAASSSFPGILFATSGIVAMTSPVKSAPVSLSAAGRDSRRRFVALGALLNERRYSIECV